MLKNMCFVDIDLSSFFSILEPFWEVPGPPKNHQKIEKIVFGTVLGSSIDFGHDFGAIFVDLGAILERFWKDFGKIFDQFVDGFTLIRATKGRSIDR